MILAVLGGPVCPEFAVHMSADDKIAALAALKSNPLYAALPSAAQAAIEGRGRIRRVAGGQQIFRKGEPGDGVYVLLSGELEYSTTSPSGKQAILNIVAPGKWLGDISTLDGKGRALDCWALTDCVLMHLAPKDFLTLFDQVPSFARMLILLQSERVRQLLIWNEALTKLGAEGRLAERLLIFAESHGGEGADGVRLGLRFTQELLADFIGTTRQRVNQVLNQWQNEGLIRREGRYIVLSDVEKLKQRVDLA